MQECFGHLKCSNGSMKKDIQLYTLGVDPFVNGGFHGTIQVDMDDSRIDVIRVSLLSFYTMRLKKNIAAQNVRLSVVKFCGHSQR